MPPLLLKMPFDDRSGWEGCNILLLRGIPRSCRSVEGPGSKLSRGAGARDLGPGGKHWLKRRPASTPGTED